MNDGKRFEHNIKKSIPDNIFSLRIQDQKFENTSLENIRFTQKNPYDLIVFYRNLFLIELKSTKHPSLSIQTNKKESGKMIKRHQIDALSKASKYINVVPGFLINFRFAENLIFFLHICKFIKIINMTDKKSINYKEVSTAGIHIPSYKKKVNYQYDLEHLFMYYSKKYNTNF